MDLKTTQEEKWVSKLPLIHYREEQEKLKETKRMLGEMLRKRRVERKEAELEWKPLKYFQFEILGKTL